MEKAYKGLTFLTDKNYITVLKAIIDAANTAIPDSLEPFEMLVPNTSNGTVEKHPPIIETNGSHVTVKMGSNSHPVSEEHSISFVCLLTQAEEVMRVYLNPDHEPVTHFIVEKGDAPVAAYICYNLHGFWKTEA